MRTYFAIVHKDEDSAVGVVFPDLPGCFSAGDTRSVGRQLPKPRTFDALYRDREVRKEAQGAAFVGIRLEDVARSSASTRRSPPKRSRKTG